MWASVFVGEVFLQGEGRRGCFSLQSRGGCGDGGDVEVITAEHSF